MAHRLRNPLIAVFTLVVCLAVHELGHVLAAYATGGRVTEVVIFSITPHVRIAGEATPLVEAVRAAGGSACSLALCFAVLVFVPWVPAGWQLAKDTTAAFACVELIGWTVSAIAGSQNASPDDAQRFLSVSGLAAPVVITACVLLASVGFASFRRSECRRRARIGFDAASRGEARVAAAGRQ